MIAKALRLLTTQLRQYIASTDTVPDPPDATEPPSPYVVLGNIALADVPDMGASVYVVTDNDLEHAQSCADELGEWIFARRVDWHRPMPSTRDGSTPASARTVDRAIQ